MRKFATSSKSGTELAMDWGTISKRNVSISRIPFGKIVILLSGGTSLSMWMIDSAAVSGGSAPHQVQFI
jgi:hypothetical protein